MAQKPRRARGPNQGKPPHGPSPQTGRRQELDVSPTDARAMPQGSAQPRGSKHHEEYNDRPGKALGKPFHGPLARPTDKEPREPDSGNAPIWDDAPCKVAQGRNGKRHTEKHRRATTNQVHKGLLSGWAEDTAPRPPPRREWEKATQSGGIAPSEQKTQSRRIGAPRRAATWRPRHKASYGWRQCGRAPRHSRDTRMQGAARNPSALRMPTAMPQAAGIPRRAEARTASPLAKYAEGDLFNMCDLEF